MSEKKIDKEGSGLAWLFMVAVLLLVCGSFFALIPTTTESHGAEDGSSTEILKELENPTRTPKPDVGQTAAVQPDETVIATATDDTEDLTESSTSKEELETPTATATSRPRVRIVNSAVNVRSGPDTNYDPVSVLHQDDVIPLVGSNEQQTWYEVELDDGSTGWVGSSVAAPELEGALVLAQEGQESGEVETGSITATSAPTSSATPTETPEPTLTPTSTATPTQTPTPTVTPTPIPDAAGISDWIVHEDKYLGVRDIEWNYSLGYFRAEQGKILVSLYMVGINMSDIEQSFHDYDFELIDGGGEVTSGVIFSRREPEFDDCTVQPGGTCEGWWTTMVWDRPEVKENLTFRWDPCVLFCEAMETPINQD